MPWPGAQVEPGGQWLQSGETQAPLWHTLGGGQGVPSAQLFPTQLPSMQVDPGGQVAPLWHEPVIGSHP
jgi:hypothetical protein